MLISNILIAWESRLVGFLSCSWGIETEFKMRLLRIRAVFTFFFSSEFCRNRAIPRNYKSVKAKLQRSKVSATKGDICNNCTDSVFQRLISPAACFQEYLQQLCTVRLVEPGLKQARQAPESFWWVSPGCGGGRDREEERALGRGERWIWSSEDGGEHANVKGLLATWVQVMSGPGL